MEQYTDSEAEVNLDNFTPNCLAVLKQNEGLVVIEASSLRELKSELAKYPPEIVLAVWRGKKLQMKAEVKTMTTISFG